MKKVYTKKELREIHLIKVFNRAGVVFCPTCKRGYLLEEEKEHIKNVGECFACDHITGEQLGEQMYSKDLPF